MAGDYNASETKLGDSTSKGGNDGTVGGAIDGLTSLRDPTSSLITPKLSVPF